MDSEDEGEPLTVCEHCGKIVPKRCIVNNTLICRWCFDSFKAVFRK